MQTANAKLIFSAVCCVVIVFAFVANTFAQENAKDSLKKSVVGDSNVPIFINSDKLSANSEKRIFSYQGNVELRRGDVFVTSDTMLGFYDSNNELETIIFEKNVVITRGEEMRASSERAEYDVKSEIIEMTQNPEILQNGNILTADKVLLFVLENRSEAVGNVRVKLIRSEADKISLGSLSGANTPGK